MSPEKPTIIFRDGWGPIVSKNYPEDVRENARRNIEDMYRNIGIILHLDKLTHIKLYYELC